MTDLKNKITQTEKEFYKALEAAHTLEGLENARLEFLARKGRVTQLMEKLKSLPLEQKKEIGPLLNTLKLKLQEAFDTKQKQIAHQAVFAQEAKKKHFDVTAVVPQSTYGSLHPLTHVTNKLNDIFMSMGFEVADGPEVETDYYNFEALNIPNDHPARDMFDTFWLDIPSLLLRTHTSTVQIHSMQQQKPPLAVVAPGRCYRHEATDASHDFVFMQVEGLLVDKNITLGHLLATVKTFMSRIFEKKNLGIRVRPSYFPFVEPGIEIDIECPFCNHGCSVCKQSEWIEWCGAGLIHPNVLQSCNIDPHIYSGFAFGFGLTRLTMLMYGIHDIRLLHSGSLEFLNQFQ